MKILKNYNDFTLNENVKSIDNVRVRFAPSPSGAALHCGGIRTALYNYLFAKKYDGKFILRIEDTDRTRFVPTAEKYFTDTFDWLGIEFDESPEKGGPYGPYKQSERTDIYNKYVQELIDNGKAYYAFDTAEELEAARENLPNFSYSFETRNDMKNSLTMDDAEVDRLLEENKDWVIRIKYPDKPVTIEVDDIIRGKVNVNSNTLDDKVIWKKKDELPTYHLANIVDDHLMKISHVIRGEEWLPSAPLHVYLYECFDWTAPQFAHLPLILGPTGGKLSKRDGDKYGFPVFPLSYSDPKDPSKIVEGYREAGYTPEAVINLLAFIGWNPGTEKEIYTMEELIKDFDLKRINKAGGKFNPVKAAWFNGQHLKNTPTEKLMESFKEDLAKRGIKKSDDFIYKVIDENKGKVNFIKELYDAVNFLFEKPTTYDEKTMKKWNDKTSDIILGFSEKLAELNTWKENKIHATFEKYVEDNKLKFNDIAPFVRLVVTGLGNGGSLFGIMEMIGKEETLDRLSDLDEFTTNIPVSSDKKGIDGPTQQRITQLMKEIDLAKASLKSTEGKLANKNFVDRAPAAVVEGEKKKVGELGIKISEMESELKQLK
jgi:glutamyl-tRNA synthetase